MSRVFYIVVNKDIPMTPGKLAAQCGHPVAEMLFKNLQRKEIIDYFDSEKKFVSKVRYENGFSEDVLKWKEEGQIKVVLEAGEAFLKSLETQEDCFSIRDMGLTELEPDTLTCIGFGPYEKDKIPEKFSFLRNLRLYGKSGKNDFMKTHNNKTNLKQIAAMLNGREYLEELSEKECEELKKEGYIVIFGYSDDNVELRGAINEEYGAYIGKKFSFTKKGLSNYDKSHGYLDAFFSKDGYTWVMETDYPHESFDILEDGDKFCRGVVVHIDSLKQR